ncbi:MAG: insulinase family protein [Gracilibacteraceae bacterium]|jgi:predicted Zn-dependent peptidase|nr:insulinase family protein [Gracilibacteraceae bacterium]
MTEKTVLPNGVRVVSEELPHMRSVALGIWIGAGSRYEREKLSGASHFAEHMLFKGTEKRGARQIAEELDAVGGQINAFTGRETTCFYARVLDEDVGVAADVLTDMFFHSVFDPAEMEKEKHVILEEIKMYEDTPDDLILDLFTENLWRGHALGRSVLGNAETLSGLTRADMLEYLAANYTPERIIIAVAGKFRPREMTELLAPFAELSRPAAAPDRRRPEPGTVRRHYPKDIEQTHIVVGGPALPVRHEDIYTLSMINNILGVGMSSELFQEIREKRGLVYDVHSLVGAYQDAGLFGIYAGTAPEKSEEVIRAVLAEGEKLKQYGVSEEKLARTFTQMKGNMFLGLESVSGVMNRIGKMEIDYGEVKTAEAVLAELQKVTPADVSRVWSGLWRRDSLSVITLGCEDEGFGDGWHDLVMRETTS